MPIDSISPIGDPVDMEVQHLILWPQMYIFDMVETRCGKKIRRRPRKEVEDLPLCTKCSPPAKKKRSGFTLEPRKNFKRGGF